ncbi:MAG: ROK family protein [Rhizobiaceae bacterium]|nr:ROK family protein [Rhizobiaceae bacterium]
MSNTLAPSGIAVDLGGTKISAARVTRGTVGDIIKVETDSNASTDSQITAICELIKKIGPSPRGGEGIGGTADNIGVAVAGRVSKDGDWYAVNSEILTQIDKVPLRKMLAQRLGQDVTVENDATAAALGEFACGAGNNSNSFAYITVSTGVGGGIILDGRPVVSGSGLAGHIGFTTSRMQGDDCGSGRTNTVESIASGRALSARATKLGHAGLSGKQVYDAHLSGAAWATQLVSDSAAAIAELSTNLKSVLDVDAAVIGGGVGLAEGYVELVEVHLQSEPPLFRPKVHRAALAENSALIGVLVR